MNSASVTIEHFSFPSSRLGTRKSAASAQERAAGSNERVAVRLADVSGNLDEFGRLSGRTPL